MLDHEDHLDSQRPTEMYLPIDRFKRKMDVSDEDWLHSLPNALTELRKGRQDLLRLVLEAAERSDGHSLGRTQAAPPSPAVPPLAASAALGSAIDEFMAEHSRQWPDKTAGQFRSYLAILLEYLGPDRRLGTVTKQEAGDVKKMLQMLPASRKGNDKGKVEGLVKYARSNFMTPVPEVASFGDLNAMLEERCRQRQGDVAGRHDETIGTRLVADLAAIRDMPAVALEPCEKRAARVSSTSLVHYRCNDYPA